MPSYISIPKSELMDQIRKNMTITSIADKYHVSRATIHNKLKEFDINHQGIKFNHNFFENIDDEYKAYWLGFIMADGCVSLTQSSKVCIKLSQKDEKHLSKWHEALNSINKLYNYIANNTTASTHYSKKMCQDLIKLGCVPNKSLILQYPQIDQTLDRHFIRGYFDGDGCIYFHKNQYHDDNLRLIFLGTLQFLNTIREKICTTAQVKQKPNTRIYCLEISGYKQARRIAAWLYEDSRMFLDRKKGKYLASLRL